MMVNGRRSPNRLRHGRDVLIAGAAVAMLALAPTVAEASSPTIERFAVAADLRLNLTSDEICGFEVWQRISGTIIVQVHVAADGTVLERDVIPGTFISVFYSRDAGGNATGKELRARSAGTQTLAIAPDGSFSYRESGSHDRIVAPSQGIIMGTIGHLADVYEASTDTETILVGGSHQITFEALANLCDPLRPEA